MNKLEKINKQIKDEMDWFSKHYTLEKSIVEEVNVHLKHAYEQEFNKEKQRQTKKLNKLIERKNSDKLTSQSMKNGYETCQNAPSQRWKKQCLCHGVCGCVGECIVHPPPPFTSLLQR